MNGEQIVLDEKELKDGEGWVYFIVKQNGKLFKRKVRFQDYLETKVVLNKIIDRCYNKLNNESGNKST